MQIKGYSNVKKQNFISNFKKIQIVIIDYFSLMFWGELVKASGVSYSREAIIDYFPCLTFFGHVSFTLSCNFIFFIPLPFLKLIKRFNLIQKLTSSFESLID